MISSKFLNEKGIVSFVLVDISNLVVLMLSLVLCSSFYVIKHEIMHVMVSLRSWSSFASEFCPSLSNDLAIKCRTLKKKYLLLINFL